MGNLREHFNPTAYSPPPEVLPGDLRQKTDIGPEDLGQSPPNQPGDNPADVMDERSGRMRVDSVVLLKTTTSNAVKYTTNKRKRVSMMRRERTTTARKPATTMTATQ